jgi:hypothetical protein
VKIQHAERKPRVSTYSTSAAGHVFGSQALRVRHLGLTVMCALMLLGPVAVLSAPTRLAQAAPATSASMQWHQAVKAATPAVNRVAGAATHPVVASSPIDEPARLPHIPFSRLRGLTRVAELPGNALSAGTAGTTGATHALGAAAVLIFGLARFVQLSREVRTDYQGRLTWLFLKPLVRPG